MHTQDMASKQDQEEGGSDERQQDEQAIGEGRRSARILGKLMEMAVRYPVVGVHSVTGFFIPFHFTHNMNILHCFSD